MKYLTKTFILVKDPETKRHLESIFLSLNGVKHINPKLKLQYKWLVNEDGVLSYHKTLKDIKKSDYIKCSGPSGRDMFETLSKIKVHSWQEQVIINNVAKLGYSTLKECIEWLVWRNNNERN